MADHLTPEQVARYLKRALSPAELIAADDHLGACESCRQRASDPQRVEAGFAVLRQDMEGQAKLGATHIAYELLEAYVDREIDDADREIVESHVELCRTCRDELRDLQDFRVSLKSRPAASNAINVESRQSVSNYGSADDHDISGSSKLPYPQESSSSRLSHIWRYPKYWAGGTAALAVLLVVALFIGRQIRLTAPPNASVQRMPADGQPANPAEQPPVSVGHDASNPLAQNELETPAELNALIGKTGTLLGGATQGTVFALVTPVGTFVEEVRPTFRWQPLAGATSYRVTVFDATLNEVAASPALSGNQWKSTVPLHRDKLYLWQVTASRNTEEVVAPALPAPEAKFEVINQYRANELAALKRTQPGAHFTLGRAYAKAGVLDDAEREFRRVSASDLNYELAQKFIGNLEALRHPGHKTN